MRRAAHPSALRALFYGVPAATAAAVPALILAAAGCSSGVPAATNRREPGDRFDPSVVLGGEKADRAEEAMVAATAGHAARPLQEAPAGRWSDVPMAIRNAARAHFAGVRSFDTSGDRIVASLALEDGQAGTVTATRDAAGTVSFECSLGTFPDAGRDQAFLASLRAEFARLGRLRRPAR
jgi:hypothetical protein